MSRYARQTVLEEVGPEGQATISAARGLVVGAGGLGCPTLQYLVGAGVGHLRVVDADVVSLSNLHRQTLYQEAEIGRAKVEAAADALRALNGDCVVEPVIASLGPDNVGSLAADTDFVLDCADSFAASYILSDHCRAAGLPLISASALGLEGYVGGFCGGAPSLRAVFPDLPERAATCATAGVLGPVVGMLGAAQAQMALSHILGLEPSPLGQLMTFDLKTFRSGGFRFDGAPEPDGPELGFIAPQYIAERDLVVELRGIDEAPEPVRAGAPRINVDDFANARPLPGEGQRAVLVCRSGLRSWRAARILQTYWTGDIALIAMGDAPETERPNS